MRDDVPQINYVAMGERIHNLREANGYTVSALAQILDVTDRVIYKWQDGATVPKLERIIHMAKLFHVSIDYIVSGEQ